MLLKTRRRRAIDQQQGVCQRDFDKNEPCGWLARGSRKLFRPCDCPQCFGAASSLLRVPCRIVFFDALLGGGAARCLISRRQLLSVGAVAELGLLSDLVFVPWSPNM